MFVVPVPVAPFYFYFFFFSFLLFIFQFAANGSVHCFCGWRVAIAPPSCLRCTLKWFSKALPQQLPRKQLRTKSEALKIQLEITCAAFFSLHTCYLLFCYFCYLMMLVSLGTLLSQSRSAVNGQRISLKRENGGEIIENDFCGICLAKRKLISNTRNKSFIYLANGNESISPSSPNLLNEDVCMFVSAFGNDFFLFLFSTNPHFFYKPSWQRLNAALAGKQHEAWSSTLKPSAWPMALYFWPPFLPLW